MPPGTARRSFAIPIALLVLLLTVVGSPALAQCLGTRYVALGGMDAGNACNVQGNPCGTIQHAINVACNGENVSVAAGDYSEDILIDHPVQVYGPPQGPIGLHITGSGTVDVVRILASNVTWSGMTVWNTPGVAGIRVGDAAHTGLHGILLQNATCRNNGIGFIFESTTSTGDYNRLNGAIARNSIANGQPDMGTGMLFVGGNGRVQMFGVLVHDNDGSGVRIAAPPAGKDNTRYIVVGSQFWANGIGAIGDGVAGIEAHHVADLELEGNEFWAHTGPSGIDDGRVAILDAVNGGGIYCNRFHDNDGGLVLSNGTTGVDIRSNSFVNQSGVAVAIDATAVTGNGLHESVFQANGTALSVQGATAFNAGHCWWGAASGPSGAYPGTGDPVTGASTIAPLVTSAAAPILARIRTAGAWDYGIAACHAYLQEAVSAASPGATILVGTGPYFEHVNIAIPLVLEGVPGTGGCSSSAIDGYQGSSHKPVLRVTGVTGLVARDLTLQNAAHGAPCGNDSGDEIGLDLKNVHGSTFTNICLRGNGIDEVRLYGDSDGNVLSGLDIDGSTSPSDGQACDHLSRDGVLLDGGPACEGGAGASADGNQIIGATIRNVAHGVRVRLATGTSITGGTIQAHATPEWDGGAFAAGVMIEAADSTTVHGVIIGNTGMTEAVRIAGRPAGACYTTPTDSHLTLLDANTLTLTSGPAVHLYKAGGDPGAPASVTLSCNNITLNATAVLTDATGAGAGAPASVIHNDVHGNTTGVSNTSADVLAASPNWWGAVTGPSGVGPGNGDSVSSNVTYAPFLTGSATQDQDGDGLSACQGDCNEADASIHPGAVDVCNGKDDDCDGTLDEDFVASATTCGVGACAATGSMQCVAGAASDSCVPGTPGVETCNGIDDDCDGTVDNVAAPAGTPQLAAERQGAAANLSWSAVAGAQEYDVVRGDSALLLASGGNFAASGVACVASHTTLLVATETTLPNPGDGVWYLVRAANCGGAGTYNGPASRQAQSRDASINAAPGTCP